MCGRYSLVSTVDELSRHFGVDTHANIPARYNIAPTQPVLVVRHDAQGERELAAVEWGLIPEWQKKGRHDKPLINARIETITEKPSFRGPIKRTRCLVPADGWYEWKTKRGAKEPWLMEQAEGGPFAFAGIWTTWHGEGGEHWLETMAIVTAAATGPLQRVHGRKPLVVTPNDYEPWLKAEDPLPRDFLESFDWASENSFNLRRVSRRINSVKYDDADCIAPPEDDPQASLF